MPATLDDVLAELKALRGEVATLIAQQAAPTLRGVTLLARHLGAVQPAGASSSSGATPPAPDAELDSERGDPEVKKDPKRWKGEPFAPRRMSLCSPEYLEAIAEAKDYSAGRNDADAAGLTGAEAATKKKYADYDRKDAGRARGWARRLRAKPAKCDGAHGGAACTDPGCYTRPPAEAAAGEDAFS